MTTKDHKKGSTSSLKHTFENEDNPTPTENSGEMLSETDLLEHPSYIELQKKLNETEESVNYYKDRMLRVQAETDNIQRRVQRDIENAHKYGLEKFILELLPVIDSLERAVTLPEEHRHSALEGVQLTLKMLYAALDKFGIKQVDPISEIFNPELHQAVATEVDSTVQPNTILNVLQKGYLLNNRLIRPALVTVSKAG